MILLLGIFLTFTLGLGFILIVGSSLRRLERLSLSFVLGLGFVTQGLFVLSVINILYSPQSILILLVISNLILWFFVPSKSKLMKEINLYFRILKHFPSYLWFKFSLFEQVIISLFAFIVFGVLLKALYWPVYYWDALALYDFRARIFTEAGGIAQSTTLASLPLHGFPAMTSLAHTLVYTLGGKDANPQFIYSLFYLALIFTFYYSVRKYCLRWFSLLMTLFLVSIPFFVEFASNAYTNLPYAFFFGMGTVYLYRFINEKEKGLLIISGILLGLAAWTRSPTEQFLLANAIVLAFWCFRNRKYYYAPLVVVGLFLMFYIPWKMYISSVLGITVVANEMSAALNAGVSSAFNIERLFMVVSLLIQSTRDISGTSLFLAILVTIFFPWQAKKNLYLLLLWVSNLFIFIFGSYIFSLSWHDWKDSIANSANRLSMFLPPFILYYVAMTIPPFLNKVAKGSGFNSTHIDAKIEPALSLDKKNTSSRKAKRSKQ